MNGFWFAEFIFSILLLGILRLRPAKQFFWLNAFLLLKCVSFPVLYTLVKYKPFGHTMADKYGYYFSAYWTFYAFEAIVSFMVIRELFLISLEPLDGLRRLGMILFQWVAIISGVVSLAVSIGPAYTGGRFLTQAVSQFQRCQSILQMCLLVFLLMVARPLGVTIQNRIFGASMGFSMLAVSDIVYSGWFHFSEGMLTPVNLIHAGSLTLALCVWIGYTFFPEPKRVPVSLPVTSALLRWNEVAKSLGKSGGRVVVVGNRELIDNDMAHWDRAVELVRAKHPLPQS